MNAATDFGAVIAGLEQQLCEALLQGDLPGLAALMGDHLVHIHSSGARDGRESYLALVVHDIEFLAIERHGLEVQAFDQVAVATGRLTQTMFMRHTQQTVHLQVMTTQVWHQGPDGWRQVSFQATSIKT